MKENANAIKEIILNGTQQEKLALFTFNNKMSVEKILFKFNLFINAYFIRYLKNKSAPFHNEMIKGYINSYRGENFINLAFRGSAKSSYIKLFLVFVILNDEDHYRKYIKILSRDLKNPKQIVTDVYNMCLEMRHLYGDVFEKEGDKKREETMGSFTLKNGVKLTAGTVGQVQRGHLQDAFRPDWVVFDDIEDSESITSQVITEGIIASCEEAITGLQPIIGSWCVLGNYLSEDGVIQWFINKGSRSLKITPILQDNKPAWDMYTIAYIEQLKKDSESFSTEYMCDPSRGDNKFFNIDRINEDMKKCKPPIQTKDGIKYWSVYQNHMRYGIGADTSEGIGKDSNALAMWNYRTGELVASYHSNQIKPELFAYYIAKLGKEYGECLVAPEINNMSGGIVITTLKNQYKEDKIFRHIDPRNSMEKESGKLGWYTTSLTKTNAFMDFRKDYNDGLIKIYDTDLLKEMKMFNTQDLSERGSGITRHFDLLMASIIGYSAKSYMLALDNRVARVTYTNI
tara:strand:+ start:5357 stop:6898 length:1542 start_codon:yes stop_codon:yes gene_type:complete